jgi:hypothetical protein
MLCLRMMLEKGAGVILKVSSHYSKGVAHRKGSYADNDNKVAFSGTCETYM